MKGLSACFYSILTVNSFFPWMPEPQTASHVLSFEHQHKPASAARSWAEFASLLCTTENGSTLSSRRNLAHLNHSITHHPRLQRPQPAGTSCGKGWNDSDPPFLWSRVLQWSLRIADSTVHATCSQQREWSDNGPEPLCFRAYRGNNWRTIARVTTVLGRIRGFSSVCLKKQQQKSSSGSSVAFQELFSTTSREINQKQVITI